MATPQFKTVSAQEDFASTKEYVDYLAGILSNNFRELLWLVSGNLDVANIKAKSVTADRMSVKELSAIAADLGKVTAGILVGALIQTAETGQRVELSSTENLLKAINAAGSFIRIIPDYAGSPTFEFNNGIGSLLAFLSGSTFVLNSIGATDISISASLGDITLGVGSGKQLKVPAWNQMYNISSGQTLQTALDYKAALIHYHSISEISGLSSTLSDLDARISALESSP